MLKSILQKWRSWRYPYVPLVEITISRERLLSNLHLFQKNNPSITVAPVLKSNAYGHDLVTIAQIIDQEKIPFIIVDSYYEALSLRVAKISSPILILGYTPLENILKNKLRNVAFTIVSLEQLEEISAGLNRSTDFHLKIDSSMHRQGVLVEQSEKAMSLLQSNQKINLIGLCSHLADSDNASSTITDNQIKIWNEIAERWQKEFPSIKYFHLSNTGGFSYSKNITANVARLGLGLYGIDPTENDRLSDLKPVLEMKTIISGTKTLKKGEKVGYNSTFEAPSDMRIATIPAGYYEGIDRELSNKGFVKIGNTFCPIVGRVSMNITTIDITDIPTATLNTPVTIVSSEPTDKNSIRQIAKITGKIPHELLVHVPKGLRRKVI